jgi:cell division protein FtsQ
MQVFEEDAGRSLYLFPAEERRRRLLAVDWVKDATVAKIWPNRVEVVIREREPVAFVELSHPGGRSRLALIDEDGVLLEQPEQSQYDLPVLQGISDQQAEAKRSVRVRIAMSMIRDLGPLAAQVSEIDVSDPDDLKITQSAGGNGVVLMLGRERFRPRLQNFLAHYPEIQRRLPEATTFDLRIDDRITAVHGRKDGG